MTAPFETTHAQNTAPVLEFRCLYTSDLRRKQKRWQDGRLKYHTFNRRVMVYDERSNLVGDLHWREDYELCDGEELHLERGGILVQVQEKLETYIQDLTELVEKRRKEKEARAAMRTANGPPPSVTTTRIQDSGVSASALRLKPLSSLLTSSGHYSRAQLQTESPFEERQRMTNGSDDSHEDGRLSKRRKTNEFTQAKSGYAQNLTGTMLTLASSKPTSTPTIRYESFVPKFAVPHKSTTTIDLISVEEQDRGLKTNVARPGTLASRRENSQTAKHRRPPPAKGSYASNLTGAALFLDHPVPAFPVGISNVIATERGVSVQSQEIFSLSSEAEYRSEVDGGSSPGKEENTKKMALPTARMKRQRQSLSPNRHSLILEDQSMLSSRTVVQVAKIKGLAETFEAPENNPKSDSRSSWRYPTISGSPVSHPAGKSRKPKAFLTKGTRRPEGENMACMNNSSSKESTGVIAPLRKPKTRPGMGNFTTENSVASRSNPGVGGMFSDPSNFTQDSAMTGSKSNESFSNAPAMSSSGNLSGKVSSLRIKSRQPRKMMMLMDGPTPRTSPTIKSIAKSLTTGKKKIIAADEPIISQAMRNLDSNILRQREKIEARLHDKRPRLDLSSDESSPAPIDRGISDHVIDQVLAHSSKTSKEAPIEWRSVRSPPTRPNDFSISVRSSSILTTSGASSTQTSRQASPPRLLPSGISPPSPDPTKENSSTSRQGQDQVQNLARITALIVRDTSSPGQLNKSLSNSKKPQSLDTSLGLFRATEAPAVITEMSSYGDFPPLSPEKPQRANGEEISRSEIFIAEYGTAALDHFQVNRRLDVNQYDSVTAEDKGLDQDCAVKDLRDKRSVESLTALKQRRCSPTNHNTAPNKFPAVVGSCPDSITRNFIEPHLNDSTSVEEAIQGSPQAQLALEKDKPYSSPSVEEGPAFKSVIGDCHRTVKDFDSNWQESGPAINSKFALRIATGNQPKFKLSKPVGRVNSVQPLGSPPLGRLWRAAGSAEGQINGPQDDLAGGMPVTPIGPWSREAFDLFGSWKPPGKSTPPV